MITFRATISIYAIVLFLLYGCGWQSNSPYNIASTGGYAVQQSGSIRNATYHTVVIKSDGFTPAELTINVGDTVNFVNDDTSPHWPASANHPTHLLYPGSDIRKCGTPEQGSIFDACRGLAQGEAYSFTFYQAGSWGYHDHLHPQSLGKIIVNAIQNNDAASSGN